MTIAPDHKPARKRLYLPPPKRWTREEYDCMIEKGIFTPEDRFELLEGEIVEKMPQNPPRVSGITRMTRTIMRIFGAEYVVRIQGAMALGDSSEPEPDIAVVEGEIEDYDGTHPTTALLVIEVSDSSLQVDRRTKAGIYARADIAEYAILNVKGRKLELRRSPKTMPDEPLGFGYAETITLNDKQTWTPLAAPQAAIPVASLLPTPARSPAENKKENAPEP